MTLGKGTFYSGSYFLDFPRSVNLLQERIRLHNERYAGAARRQIKAVHAALAEKLIRLYKQEFARWQAERLWQVELAREEWPTLGLNNPFLARIMVCTDRSIRNYRKRLEELGFLTATVCHGRTSDFEVRLNPEFLWVAPVGRPAQRVVSRKSFPPTSTGTTTGTIQPEPVGGKVCRDESEVPAVAEAPLPERTGTGNRNGSREPSVGRDREALLRRHAGALLKLAMLRLYGGLLLDPDEEKRALQAVEGLFGDAEPERFGRISENYAARLGLVRQFWEERMGKLPPPWEFFDRSNEGGFVITRKWLKTE